MDGSLGTSARNKCGNYGAEIYDEKNPLKAFFEAPEEEDDQYEDPELISIGSSMSFYPNCIKILSKLYQDFIQIVSRFYPNLILILYKLYPDFIQAFFKKKTLKVQKIKDLLPSPAKS